MNTFNLKQYASADVNEGMQFEGIKIHFPYQVKDRCTKCSYELAFKE